MMRKFFFFALFNFFFIALFTFTAEAFTLGDVEGVSGSCPNLSEERPNVALWYTVYGEVHCWALTDAELATKRPKSYKYSSSYPIAQYRSMDAFTMYYLYPYPYCWREADNTWYASYGTGACNSVYGNTPSEGLANDFGDIGNVLVMNYDIVYGGTLNAYNHDYTGALFDPINIGQTIIENNMLYGPVFPEFDDVDDTIDNLIADLINDNRPVHIDLSGEDWGIWEFVKPTIQYIIDALYNFIDMILDVVVFFSRLIFPDTNYFSDSMSEINTEFTSKFSGVDITSLTGLTFTTTQPPDINMTFWGDNYTIFSFNWFPDNIPSYRTFFTIAIGAELVFLTVHNIFKFFGHESSNDN